MVITTIVSISSKLCIQRWTDVKFITCNVRQSLYLYSLFWKYYCKCGVLGKQFFFFSLLWKYNLLWHYFRSGIGSASNKCKKKIRYSLHCSSDPSLQSVIVLQRWDAWMHFSWFAQANWSALQVTRWSKESHESWPIVDTNYKFFTLSPWLSRLRYISRSRCKYCEPCDDKEGQFAAFRFFFVYIRVYIYIHFF